MALIAVANGHEFSVFLCQSMNANQITSKRENQDDEDDDEVAKVRELLKKPTFYLSIST